MNNNETGKLWSGIMFIILGFIFLLQELFPRLDFEDFWPVLLIITGIIIMYDGLKKTSVKTEKTLTEEPTAPTIDADVNKENNNYLKH